MTPRDFLRAVWPANGPYCIGYQAKTNTSKPYYKNIVVDSIDEALEKANRLAGERDMFFSVLGLRERELIDPEQRNPKTGEFGKRVVRVHANMTATKAHVFDVDAGKDKPYPDQPSALRALKEWVQRVQLPVPTIVSSGNGLHVYWLTHEEIPADTWAHHGELQQALADHCEFHVDRSRTKDKSGVLRIPGTFNRKDTVLDVTILHVGDVTHVTDLHRMLRDAAAREGVTVTAAKPKAKSNSSAWGESNLNTEFSGPKPTLKEVGDTCAQVREMVKLRGNLDQSAWYHAQLNTIKWVENGEELCHAISAGHSSYNKAETDAKLAQLSDFAPARCDTIAKYMPGNGAACVGCRWLNDPSVPNPLVAARRNTEAPAPVVQTVIEGVTLPETTIPNPPAPYTRLKEGGISRRGKNADGDEVTDLIYPYDLYPVRRLTDPNTNMEQQLWCVTLPLSGKKEFLLDAHALYDSRKFTETISHQGVYPSKANVPYLQDYMVAYITELQRLVEADLQSSHLGWIEDFAQFVLPDKVISRDGSIRPALLTRGAATSSASVGTAGTLERQVELMRFFEDDRYVAHQSLILSGLSSIILHMTGQHGMIVNLTGPSGASKSTALYSTDSLWGVPKQYSLNGTNDGATTKGRNERVTVMSNLPVNVDEVTYIPVKSIQDLAMFVTQPTGRLRLNSDGTERQVGSKHKSTMMLCTSNVSLHGLLASDNAAGTAGSMRLFEIEARLHGVHEKHEADAFLRELAKNYGHIGPAMVKHVLLNYEYIERRVHEVMREIDFAANIQPPERNWSAKAAADLVVNEEGNKLGLLRFSRDNYKNWLINVQIPQMRGIVVDEYNTPISVLTNYLESIAGNILFVEQSVFGGKTEPYTRNKPHGALLAHYDVLDGRMYVLKDGFKSYCRRVGASATGILKELNVPRRDLQGNLSQVVTERTTKKTLGAGTEFAKAQSYCFVIDMTHPEMAEGPHPLTKTTPGGRPNLKLVGEDS